MHRARSPILLLMFLLAGAGSAAGAQQSAYVVTTDYTTGGLSAVNLDTRAVSVDVATVHSDATLRWFLGLLYVVNRFGQDNIQEIDPASSYHTVRQFSTGPGSNPQDIAFRSPTKCYVSRYDRPELGIYNPATGASLGNISLAAFADADGLPEMAHLAIHGNRLFVAVQRLNRNAGFTPTAYSQVVVVDTDADTVFDVNPFMTGKQAITLMLRNPITTFSYDSDLNRLLIGCAGFFGPLDGGIEAIDLTSLASAGVVVTESTLGGDVNDVEWWSSTHSYAIVSDASFNAHLVAWNPTTHGFISNVFSPGGFSLADCAINDRDELWVCDNAFSAPGRMVFRAGTDALLAGPLDTGLPPNQITFDQARMEVAGVEPNADALAFAPPWPNPARTSVHFSLTLARAGEAKIEAFDLSGRRVRTIASGAHAAVRLEASWALDDERGRGVAAGLYLVRATAAGVNVVRHMVVLR